jgi:anti-sigma regulatory factor (Ser/Thr protein kinase)
MIANGTYENLTLRSRLSDLAPIAPWIERLGLQHAIPHNVRFAMNLCLEEALSNIIRHGYNNAPDRFITVRFSAPRENSFAFVIDDDAPHFNPLELPDAPPVAPSDSLTHDAPIGGQGLRLLRHFADTLQYEPKPVGNRLTIGFSLVGANTSL